MQHTEHIMEEVFALRNRELYLADEPLSRDLIRLLDDLDEHESTTVEQLCENLQNIRQTMVSEATGVEQMQIADKLGDIIATYA